MAEAKVETNETLHDIEVLIELLYRIFQMISFRNVLVGSALLTNYFLALVSNILFLKN